MASGDDSDTVLSQALEIYEDYMEDRESESIFITQNTFCEVPDNEKNSVIETLSEAVDLSDMFDVGGFSEVGAFRAYTTETGMFKFTSI